MEHKTSTGASQAKKQLPSFLGGVLMLTHIAYQAIGMISQLPPPLDENDQIQFHQRPYRHKPVADNKRRRESGESATSS